jgi:hypothetical protein
LSTNAPNGLVWAYWTVTSVVLGVVTFYFAFWGRLKNSWMLGWRPSEEEVEETIEVKTSSVLTSIAGITRRITLPDMVSVGLEGLD